MNFVSIEVSESGIVPGIPTPLFALENAVGPFEIQTNTYSVTADGAHCLIGVLTDTHNHRST